MNYIIDPMMFYWMDILNAVEVFAFIMVMLFGITTILMIIGIIGLTCDIDGRDEQFCRSEIAMRKTLLKWLPLVIILFVLSVLIDLLVPSKDTMLYMLIAHTATIENCELTIDGIKAIVDYIIEAMAQLK